MRRPWLVPFMPLYVAGLAVRNLRLRKGWEPIQKLSRPVISIGNLSVGGAGKTPLTIALAKELSARGLAIDVLSRGYGRKSKEPARVDPTGTAEQYGDEPLLIARATGLPVYVAALRYDAGILAEQEPAKEKRRVHLLDDGFQHRQLHRDIDVLLLNREDWRDSLLPTGNRRETLRAALRAHVVAIPAEDSSLESELRSLGFAGPVWHLERRMQVPEFAGPVLAFCGIARPGQFFAGLESAGLTLATRVAMPDHHAYSAADVERLVDAARSAGAGGFVTTEKDWVRLGPLVSAFPLGLPVLTAGLTTEIANPQNAVDWLLERLGREAS